MKGNGNSNTTAWLFILFGVFLAPVGIGIILIIIGLKMLKK